MRARGPADGDERVARELPSHVGVHAAKVCLRRQVIQGRTRCPRGSRRNREGRGRCCRACFGRRRRRPPRAVVARSHLPANTSRRWCDCLETSRSRPAAFFFLFFALAKGVSRARAQGHRSRAQTPVVFPVSNLAVFAAVRRRLALPAQGKREPARSAPRSVRIALDALDLEVLYHGCIAAYVPW